MCLQIIFFTYNRCSWKCVIDVTKNLKFRGDNLRKEGEAGESKKSRYSFDIMTQIKKLQDLLYFKGTINQCSVMLKNLEDKDLDISLKISVSILNY